MITLRPLGLVDNRGPRRGARDGADRRASRRRQTFERRLHRLRHIDEQADRRQRRDAARLVNLRIVVDDKIGAQWADRVRIELNIV